MCVGGGLAHSAFLPRLLGCVWCVRVTFARSAAFLATSFWNRGFASNALDVLLENVARAPEQPDQLWYRGKCFETSLGKSYLLEILLGFPRVVFLAIVAHPFDFVLQNTLDPTHVSSAIPSE